MLSESFFKLHDLDQDGILSRNELEAIYGLHHETSREKSSDDADHQRKTDEILAKVLGILDQNGDGVITKTEFVSAGRDGLPEFSDHEGLGHHYDSEGEYFLVSPIFLPYYHFISPQRLTVLMVIFRIALAPAPRRTLSQYTRNTDRGELQPSRGYRSFCPP